MRLRLATTDDATAIRDAYRPYVEATAISFETVVPGIEEMAVRIATTLPTHPWLVAVDGGELLGYAYAHPFASRAGYRWSTESSVYVRSTSQGAGVGRRLYAALLLLLEMQGYREIFAGITLPNDPSVSLHERMGFAQVAHLRRAGWKLGSWHDVGWWQRSATADAGAVPPEPVATASVDPAVVAELLGE